MVASLYRDILSGYSTWEESPLGMLTKVIAMMIKNFTAWAVPLVYVLLIIRLPIINGDPMRSCVNTWALLLGVPLLLVCIPAIKALAQSMSASRNYQRRWCYA